MSSTKADLRECQEIKVLPDCLERTFNAKMRMVKQEIVPFFPSSP